MAKIFWIILSGWSVFVILLIINVKAPYTITEVRESYTAYSLGQTLKDTNGKTLPILFKADGDYLSTFGVYERLLPIKLFGLNNFGIRSAGIFIGALTIYLFYLFLRINFNKIWFISIPLILFSFSPLFIKNVIFDVGSLTLLTLLLAILTNKKFRKLFSVTFLIFTLAILIFNRDYVRDQFHKSILYTYMPQNYTFQIDKRLSFGLIYGSPLIINNHNFNRIVLNKFFYATNSIFDSFISPFNFEKVSFPFQSLTVLSKDSDFSNGLPILYFWEIPIIFLTFVFVRKLPSNNLKLAIPVLLLVFLSKSKLILLILPLISICESYFLDFIIYSSDKYGKYLIYPLICFYVLNVAVISDIFIQKSDRWSTDMDMVQYKIWNMLSEGDLKNKIIVTDRFGEPVFYYLVYKKVNPEYYFSNKTNGAIIDNSVQRIDSVGNVYFRSFNFANEPKEKNEIWIGVGKDYGEKNLDLKLVKT